MKQQVAIDVVESSQVGEVRRKAVAFGEAADFREAEQGKLAIVVTEMANNLVRHAQQGRILLQVVQTGSEQAVEVLSVDSGPGIADIDQCLQDGYSTIGTCGTGLGAIKRLSREFDIYSQVAGSHAAVGTVIVSRVTTDRPGTRVISPFTVGSVSIPMVGEEVCGDAWTFRSTASELHILVADGLGHGPLAQQAALTATTFFHDGTFVDPKSNLQLTHRALSGTRGAAAAIASLDVRLKNLRYAGVGNISGLLLSGDRVQGLISHNGIVGVQQRKTEQYDYPFETEGLLIMHSDGLKSRWSLNDHPGLRARHPALISGVLYRDYCRTRDDVTIVVARFDIAKE